MWMGSAIAMEMELGDGAMAGDARMASMSADGDIDGGEGEEGDDLPTVVIVGAGPAGLFCALTLARSGRCRPVLLERGQLVEARGRDIGALIHRRAMNTESNFAFGEGGVGTVSDNKSRRSKGLGWGGVVSVRWCGGLSDFLLSERPQLTHYHQLISYDRSSGISYYYAPINKLLLCILRRTKKSGRTES